jgi:hypothetical protein
MQFRLLTLLIATTIVSMLCALLLTAPIYVAAPILCAVLWICPALWVNGIIYGRGAWRPFFIGGFMAGLVPYLVALYVSMIVALQLFEGDLDFGSLVDASAPWANLILAGYLLGPGAFSFPGGLIGVAVYRWFRPSLSEGATVTSEAMT